MIRQQATTGTAGRPVATDSLDDAPKGMRARLLPTVMIAAGLALGLKLATIYDNQDQVLALLGISPAFAQEAGEAPTDAAADAPVEEAVAEGDTPTAPAPELGEGRSMLPDATQTAAFDPTQLTQSEVDLLQSLAERRRLLDERERELAVRENLLTATEIRVDEKIDELKRIETNIDSLLVEYDEQEEQRLQSLVKIYETMKPRRAAAIFEELDMFILLDVAERMREAKLALVLQQLSSQRARDVTTELANRRQLPGELQGQGG